MNVSNYQKEIFKKFNKYAWEKPILKNECIEKANKELVLNPTQQFISRYIQPSSENGILLYHSVGSGKTLSAIAILKNFEKQGYNMIWVTRKSLRKSVQTGLDLLPLKSPLTIISYKQFSNITTLKTKLYYALLEKARKLDPKTNDILFKTIVIIDEVHKLFETSDLIAQETHNIEVIKDMIYKSYENKIHKNRCKIILLSATPVLKDPLEIVNLLNLIIVNPNDRFDVPLFKKDYLTSSGYFTKNGAIKFRKCIKDLVSYIDISKNPNTFVQVNYQEVLVPISAPTFQEILDQGNNCNENYKYCRSHGLPDRECKKIQASCMKELGKYKEIAKKISYQSTVLQKRCNLKLDF